MGTILHLFQCKFYL